jgi:hypothetical protein
LGGLSGIAVSRGKAQGEPVLGLALKGRREMRNLVIEESGALAAGRPDDSPTWREIAYLSRHTAAERLRSDWFRCRGVPLGSGAIESTVRRLINLRLKGTSTFWEKANAEAVIQLQAAVLSGRRDEVLDRTRAATARDRRKD